MRGVLLLCCLAPYVPNALVIQFMAERRAVVETTVMENRARGLERATAKNIDSGNELISVWDAGEIDRRMQNVRDFVPARSTIGYVGDEKFVARLYFITQYSLVPRVVVASSQPDFVLVDFFSPQRYRQAQRDRVLERWVEESDLAPIARWGSDTSTENRNAVTRHRTRTHNSKNIQLLLVKDFGNGLMLFRHREVAGRGL